VTQADRAQAVGNTEAPVDVALTMTQGPNLIQAAASILRAKRVSAPAPVGADRADHRLFSSVLDDLQTGGISSLPGNAMEIDAYRDAISMVSPNALTPQHALAYWINLYNAGALRAAGVAFTEGASSAVRVPGAFSTAWVRVDGEALSLEDIEHGKIRRFGDPRIHAALVCGSVSCPTLRFEPFDGDRIDEQLNDQMRVFLRSGGASLDRTNEVLYLSRLFLWYGRDFTRPDLMPTTGPARQSRIRDTIAWWLEPSEQEFVWAAAPRVEFLPYDWGLSCSIAPAATNVP
jgi:hypothetical protein